jgi:hypothetical protein
MTSALFRTQYGRYQLGKKLQSSLMIRFLSSSIDYIFVHLLSYRLGRGGWSSVNASTFVLVDKK